MTTAMVDTPEEIAKAGVDQIDSAIGRCSSSKLMDSNTAIDELLDIRAIMVQLYSEFHVTEVSLDDAGEVRS